MVQFHIGLLTKPLSWIIGNFIFFPNSGRPRERMKIANKYVFVSSYIFATVLDGRFSDPTKKLAVIALNMVFTIWYRHSNETIYLICFVLFYKENKIYINKIGFITFLESLLPNIAGKVLALFQWRASSVFADKWM